MSEEVFWEEYMKIVTPHFSDILEPSKFVETMLKSAEVLMGHRDYSTAAVETFLNHFTDMSGIDRDTVWDRISKFYETDFYKLKQFVKNSSTPRSIIDTLKTKGKKIILATNPVFPEIATRQRVEWAGLDYDTDFLFVPVITNFNTLKPDPEYFRILLNKVHANPKDTLMVGNDFLFDGSASQVGIKTWIVDENQSNLDYKQKFTIDYEGSLDQLLSNILENN